MTHINDLDPKVLYRILCLASGELAKDIDEWKHRLYLLQVCTKWYNLLKHYVFSQGFVDICLPVYREDSDVVLSVSCTYYVGGFTICRSNLGIITRRDKYNCDCVTELKVMAEKGTIISTCLHVLKELLTIGVGYWLNLSLFSFIVDPVSNYFLCYISDILEENPTTALNYIHDFQNRLPNITHLNVILDEDSDLRTALCIIVNHYAPHLQLLHLNNSFNYSLLEFPTILTSLSLNLRIYTHRHPSFYAKSLQYLKLCNISSSSFSWWIFHDFTTPGCIEFTDLKT